MLPLLTLKKLSKVENFRLNLKDSSKYKKLPEYVREIYFMRFPLFYPGDLVTHMGEWEIRSVCGRLYCGIKIQLNTLLSNVHLLPKLFTQNVLNWFNQVNECQFSPTNKETLFSITASSLDTTAIIRKFNYTALLMCHY